MSRFHTVFCLTEKKQLEIVSFKVNKNDWDPHKNMKISPQMADWNENGQMASVCTVHVSCNITDLATLPPNVPRIFNKWDFLALIN